MKLNRTVAPVVAVVMGWALMASTPRAQVGPGRPALTGAVSQAAVAVGVSKAVSDLPAEPRLPDSGGVGGRATIRAVRNPMVRTEKRTGQSDEWMDLAVQFIVPSPLMPAPILTFEGLSSQDNANVYGGRVLPPDTVGDVGPNHYVQQTNLLVRVFDKAGVPLTAPFKLSTLFTSGGICSTTNSGDPVVVYDPLADRWILSQFAFNSVSAPPYHECFAVSRTGDPTGQYFLYDFVTPGNEFPDYPKLGVWPDAYYMTVNQFTSGGPFNGAGAYAFDRKKMLAGDSTATFNYFNLNLVSHPEGIGGLLPADFDGLVTPPAGAPDVFGYFLATEFGDALDGLRLFDFHADFVNPANATFSERAESPLAVAAFNPLTGGAKVPQPGGAPLDVISDRLMNRLQYRNTGSSQTLVVTHSVDADATALFRAGVRYYDLRRTGATYAVSEQATFSPDTTHRWMGSAATDHDGNLAVGYSASSASVFPGIRFAGRLATDAPGGLFQGESTAIAGTGVQTHSSGRWGDYSALTVDPVDDCTFWFATEYYTAAGQASSAAGWQTRIATFRFPSCSPALRGTINVHVTDCGTAANMPSAAVSVGGVLYGVTDTAGVLVAHVDPSTYVVTATTPAGSASTSVTVSSGGTAAADLCIGSGGASPDLIIASLSARSRIAAGQSIAVKDTTVNAGLGVAAASTTSFWLSTNPTLGDDILLGSRAVPSLAASGGSSSVSTTVTIPAGTAPGSYYILANADSGAAITESDETNNLRSKKVFVGPDLRVKALSAPAAAARGTSIAVSDTTGNVGGAAAGATITRFYLSLNSAVDGSDLILGSRSVPALAGGASHQGVTTVLIPAAVAPGPYRILAVADATGLVTEASESNNTKVWAITITP